MNVPLSGEESSQLPIRLLIDGASKTTTYSLPGISDLPEVVTLNFLVTEAKIATCQGDRIKCFNSLQESSSIIVNLGKVGSLLLFQNQHNFDNLISSLHHSGSINSEFQRFCQLQPSFENECRQGLGNWERQVLRGVVQILYHHVLYAGVAGFESVNHVLWFGWGLFEPGTVAIQLLANTNS